MENPGAATLSDSNDAICRLCLKRDHCADLNDFSENFADDILAKCIPEVDIKSTRDPKICLSCQTYLLNYYKFVTECLAKQENIMECDDQEAIKSEELDIKTEEEECDGSYKQETNHTSVNWDPNQNDNEIKLEFPKDHKPIEDVAVTRYNCYHCPYMTKRMGDLSQHLLIHRKSLEIRTYDCSLCPYKAKRKSHLTEHMLIHKDASEIAYDCNFCSYKTKLKSDLTKHMLMHKDASEVTTYNCSFCSYKAIRKSDLTKHMLIHKDASEITTYDCSFCSYKAKRKNLFNPFCSYKTKRKSNLTGHTLIHKDASEGTTYDCSFCSYKAKRKIYLTSHMLTHKDNSEVTTYQCAHCPYKAKRKSHLTRHMLTHKDISETDDVSDPVKCCPLDATEGEWVTINRAILQTRRYTEGSEEKTTLSLSVTSGICSIF
ncbi:hypothetical protein NQ318_011672 [Aromia moschata]|uniref:C2H2-type domain-containing protein n=1 Tax=Aromia moschata TaxID=1265417 RepID=A0AAV8X3J0_9CUCU|nr:hypothetical protein NQ318_011672 [Aromia moschata]